MMGPYRRGFRRVLHDVRERRHLEAYALFLVTVTLTVVGLVGDLPDRVVQPVILAALAFLIFWTTAVRERAPGAASLDTVLLRHTADIRRWIQRGGTSARVVILDPSSPGVDASRAQLDQSTDLDSALGASLATVSRLDALDDFELRLLGVNPGFSLVVLDPRRVGGRLFVEFHGFQDDSIGDRMHLEIRRSQSLHWFEYSVGRFEAIWEVARKPA
jgi:hypothetical protein